VSEFNRHYLPEALVSEAIDSASSEQQPDIFGERER
jgi:hypothetical protein